MLYGLFVAAMKDTLVVGFLVPLIPWAVRITERTFTFALPSTFAISETAPGVRADFGHIGNLQKWREYYADN